MNSYVGRFAPSPTGELHFGSLVAAFASWLDAKHHGGQWLLRIEDIDPAREVEGASAAIIAALEHHGLIWDGNICWQHQRSQAYDQALQQLAQAGYLYACICTRKQIRAFQAQTAAQGCANHCRTAGHCIETNPLRFINTEAAQSFNDLCTGPMLPTGAGSADFLVRRRDGHYAYQLAVTVDDAAQSVTHVVRGADLLTSTHWQIALQDALGYQRPQYLHVPVVTSDDGQKLSKQTGAPPLIAEHALANLLRAWRQLAQVEPPSGFSSVHELLQFAVENWSREHLSAHCETIDS